MRIVLDTNVFVSTFFGGVPRQIVHRWAQGDLTLCLSQKIIREYIEVLERLGLAEDEEMGQLLRLLARGYHCLFASRTPDLRIVTDDPDDDMFIECAVALDAKIIVSGDKALLAVGEYVDIRVVSPREFVDKC